MAKRKVVAGGYDESSDGPESELVLDAGNPAKKTKSASYAPVRLTTMPETGKAPLQLPQYRSSSGRSSVPPITSSLSHSRVPSESSSLSRAATSNPQSDCAMVDATQPEILAPHKTSADSATNLKAMEAAPNPSTGLVSALTKTTQARSTIALERQLNEVLDEFKSYTSSNNAQHNQTHETLACLVEVVNRLIPTEGAAFTPMIGQPVSAGLAILDPKPLYSNPAATPELIAVISKVVSEARNRVGKKKGGSEDNSLKEHARTTFYRMLGITAAKAIQPYFEDDFGDPDTLPAQFVDPDTKDCQPYPHWKAALTKQTAWIPTYILRFCSTIPNDRSELSTILRNLSDEQVVTLLNDGPFKTAQTVWRDMKKSDEELEVMRKNARKYQRTERKAAIRSRYIKMIPSLQGPEWEYLSHSGYMSHDESDNEGGIVTKRPNHRSQWATNLYEAVRAAQLKKARSQPGLCPRPPQRRIEISDCPIPHLERGTGNSKVTVRIALCGISKLWRENHSGELLGHNHCINSKVLEKPDISSFLAQHPMPDDGDDDHNGDTEADDTDPWDLEHVPTESGGSKYGTHGDQGENTGDGQSAVNRELDHDVGAGRDSWDEGEGKGESKGKGDDGLDVSNGPVKTAGVNSNSISDLQIDPQLLSCSAGNNAAQRGQNRPYPTVQQASGTAHSMSSTSVALQTPELAGLQTTRDPAHASCRLPYPEMPPPPLLKPAAELALVDDASNGGTSKVATRQAKKLVGTTGNKATPVDTLARGGSAPGPPDMPELDPNAPQPKRRGRPPGSKNKNKAS